MKKIFTLTIFLFLTLSLFGQTQRLVLIEHFTQASCGPCAIANPPMQKIIDANTSKVISIRHQTSWPGTDPMNAHNPTQVRARVSYYGVTGVPASVMDGTGPGSPQSVVTSSNINRRYKATSPFIMELSASNTPDLDHADIHVKITAAQDFSGTINAKVAIIEKEINFLRAPGSNGEKAFFNVMKTLLPSTTGQSLPSSFKKGDVFEFDVEWDFENVYDITELAVVSYIQENRTKQIHQAAYHPPFVQPTEGDDATIKWSSIDNGIDDNEICGSSAIPNIRLVNTGTKTIKSAHLEYSINGGPLQSYDWSGTLRFLQEKTIKLPEIPFTHIGDNSLYVNVTTCNGNPDASDLNSKVTSSFSYAPSVTETINISLTNMRKADRMSWQLLNGAGDVHAESGVLSARDHIVDVQLDKDECYEFIVDNTYTGANGKLKIKDANGETILYYRSFPAKTKIHKEMTTAAPVATNNTPDVIEDIAIYPNPSKGDFNISLSLKHSVDVQFTLSSILGESIFSKTSNLEQGNNKIPMNLNNRSNGIYLLNIKIGEKQITKKIVISK